MPDPVQNQYDRAARFYDRLWAGYVRDTQDLLGAAARIRPDEHVLDVGCGTGAVAARLVAAHREQHVTGVDVSEGMLAEARRKTAGAPHVRFERASMEALPLPDALVDVVVSTSALHYARQPGVALAEMARVLRPGGRLAIVDWDRGRWWMAAMDRVLHLADPAHGRTLSVADVQHALGEAGFERVAVERVRRGVWGFWIATARAPAHRSQPS